jgi:hypothetical protein
LKTTLPTTLLFDYPTGETLANYLLAHASTLAVSDEQDTVADTKTVVRPDAAATELAALETLSDEEAEALLVAELEQLEKGHRHGKR